MIRLLTYPTYRSLKNQVNFKARLEISLEVQKFIASKNPDWTLQGFVDLQNAFEKRTRAIGHTVFLTQNPNTDVFEIKINNNPEETIPAKYTTGWFVNLERQASKTKDERPGYACSLILNDIDEFIREQKKSIKSGVFKRLEEKIKTKIS